VKIFVSVEVDFTLFRGKRHAEVSVAILRKRCTKHLELIETLARDCSLDAESGGDSLNTCPHRKDMNELRRGPFRHKKTFVLAPGAVAPFEESFPEKSGCRYIHRCQGDAQVIRECLAVDSCAFGNFPFDDQHSYAPIDFIGDDGRLDSLHNASFVSLSKRSRESRRWLRIKNSAAAASRDAIASTILLCSS